jgi:hypothetical protein
MSARLPQKLIRCAVVAALIGAGCGGEDEPRERDIGLDGPSPTVIAPSEPAVLDLPSTDGFLRSANEREVVLVTADGRRKVFKVRPEDVPKLGIEHLRSHAGLTDVGFRVYYEEEAGTRVIKYAHEIPPPFAAR